MSELEKFKNLSSLLGLLTPDVIDQLLPELLKSRRPMLFLPNLEVQFTNHRDDTRTSQFLIWNPFEFQYQKLKFSLEEGWRYLGEDTWWREPNEIKSKGESCSVPISTSYSQKRFMWHGYLIFSGNNAKIFKKMERTYQCVFEQEHTSFYPFTLENGKEVLIAEKVEIGFGKQKDPQITTTLLDENLKVSWCRLPKEGLFMTRFLSPGYFLKGFNYDSKTQFNLSTEILKLVQLKNQVGQAELISVQEFKINYYSIKSLSNECFISFRNNTITLYWKPNYSSVFTNLGEVFSYPNSLSILSEIEVLDCRRTHSDKKSIASKLPIEGVPQDLLVEILEFLVPN
jgi:hypothetical protein